MKSLKATAASWMLCLSCVLCFAQSAAPVPPPAPTATTKPTPEPAKITVPLSVREPLLAAIHKQDKIEKQISDLNMQFVQIQQRAQQQLQQLQQQKTAADAAVESAKKKAFEAVNLDAKKYEIDADAEPMQFMPKPEPKAEAKK
jgi:uncharacterized lipoprotein YehR (DUF1307 family)